jgi:hypothetical protein
VIYEKYSLKRYLRYLAKSILRENGKYKENKQAKTGKAVVYHFGSLI